MASITGSVATGKDLAVTQWERINQSTFIRTKSRGDTTTKLKYVVEKLVGSGGYGQVYKLIPDDISKRSKAIKICKSCQTSPGLKTLVCHLFSENTILENLPQGDGLPKPPKAFFPYDAETKSPAAMILHLYDFDFSKNFYSKLTDLELLDAFRQLAFGLARIHSEGIRHWDLAYSNLVYDLRKKKAVFIDPTAALPYLSAKMSASMDVSAMTDIFSMILSPKTDNRFTEAHLYWPREVREILDSSRDISIISSKLEEFYKTKRLTARSSSYGSFNQKTKFDFKVQLLLIDVLKAKEATSLLKAIEKAIACYNSKSKAD